MTYDDLYTIALTIFILVFVKFIFSTYIFPMLVKKGTKKIEVNPKWLTKELREKYYGFDNIDIILAEATNAFGIIPRMVRNEDRYELLLPNDTDPRDIDFIAKLALVNKIRLTCGMDFSEKPIYWLSIMCYMLDGGPINHEAIKWEDVPVKK